MRHLRHYFAAELPHILAHRGLHVSSPENSLAAFRAALEAGATHLETDVRSSRDGIAVLVHDPDVISQGENVAVASLTFAELKDALPSIASLEKAFTALPRARFNIDIKSEEAVAATVKAITNCSAEDRVLIASFSAKRRESVLRDLTSVATSASVATVVLVRICSALKLTFACSALLKRVDAMQVPRKMWGLSIPTRSFIDICHRHGVFVHVWTVNVPQEMIELIKRGVDGIITDRCDLGVSTLR